MTVDPGWLLQPIDRFRDLIEGVYPEAPVTGRSIASGTFKATKTHGELTMPEFPATRFHRGFSVTVLTSGGVPGDPPNTHGASMRRRAVVMLRIGYVYGKDALRVGAGAGTAQWEPTLVGHQDHEQIEQAARYPAHWSGLTPTMVSCLPLGDAETRELTALSRLLVERRWELVASYAPGATWA